MVPDTKANLYLRGHFDLAFARGDRFLRFVEARLRIVTDRPLTEIPDPGTDLEKLARRAGYVAAEGIAATEPFLRELSAVTRSIRTVYTEVVEGLLGTFGFVRPAVPHPGVDE